MDDVYKNMEEYNPKKPQRVLVVFDDIMVHMLSNKKLNPTVTDISIWGRELNIYIYIYIYIFLTQSYSSV